MKPLSWTLLSDGSSDEALMPIIDWLLRQHLTVATQGEWAELRKLPKPPKTLSDRIAWSLRLYPCDVLFVHRDAEKQTRSERIQEIQAACGQCDVLLENTPVSVIPVRMIEAWLLFDEAALRKAAGNPCGRQEVSFPPLRTMENQPDPKQILYDQLVSASGLNNRRLKQFRPQCYVRRLAEYIEDFSPLRVLPAFAALEADVAELARRWQSSF